MSVIGNSLRNIEDLDSDDDESSKYIPIDEFDEISLNERSALRSFIRQFREIKKSARLLERELTPLNRDKKFISDEIKKILLPKQEILSKFLLIDEVPAYFVEGEEVISEQLLLEAGLTKDLIQKCKVRRPGHYVIDRQVKGE